jgi:putative aldouronate transport system permease protein
MAYPMSKYEMPGRKFFFMYCFFTMLFSGGLIPTFMVVRGVGLYNKVWALIIPSAMNVWYMILLTNFFTSIPMELEESARIDGASNFRILRQIILPLSLPALATIGLFYAVIYWNSWFAAVIYMSDSSKYPMQTLLRQLLYSSFSNTMEVDATNIIEPPDTTVRSAAIVVTTFPILLVYPFVQKYFVKGVMIGAVKG